MTELLDDALRKYLREDLKWSDNKIDRVRVVIQRSAGEAALDMLQSEQEAKELAKQVGLTLGFITFVLGCSTGVYASRAKVFLSQDTDPWVRVMIAVSFVHAVGIVAHASGKNSGQRMYESEAHTEKRLDKVPELNAMTFVNAGAGAIYHGALSGYKHRSVGRGIAQGCVSLAISAASNYVTRRWLHTWLRDQQKKINKFNREAKTA